MKPTLDKLKKDIRELKQKHDLEKPTNDITKEDMYNFSCFLSEKNPRIGVLLKKIGDHLAINNLRNLYEDKIKPDIENPIHEEYIKLHYELIKLKMIEFKKWKAPLTDEEVYNKIKTRNY